MNDIKEYPPRSSKKALTTPITKKTKMRFLFVSYRRLAMSSQLLERTAQQVDKLVDYAVKDPLVAQSLFNVLSNLLDVDDELLRYFFST